MRNFTRVIIVIFCAILLVSCETSTAVNNSADSPKTETVAIIKTEAGTIKIRLYSLEMPKLVNNFITLAQNGFFNGKAFNMNFNGLLIECGSSISSKKENYSIPSTPIADELPSSFHDFRGIVSFANTDFRTNNGSFFILNAKTISEETLSKMKANNLSASFINLFETDVEAPWLDNKSTVFGQVIEGINVVNKIASMKNKKLHKTYTAVKIITIDIIRKNVPPIAPAPNPNQNHSPSPSLIHLPTSFANAPFPLKISTYDGKNQPMHPKVLYFDKAWNGYHYWMCYTPYAHSNAAVENPCIAVSQNGIDWITPPNVTNPLVPPPIGYKFGAHNSDVNFVFVSGTLELWYRVNQLGADKHVNKSIDYIDRITSKDGINWSAPESVTINYQGCLSPAVVYENGTYKFWYTQYDRKLYLIESKDAKNWSNPVPTDLFVSGFCIWHQDVIKTSKGYEIVFCACKKSKGFFDIVNLFYAVSKDGIHFSRPINIINPSKYFFKLDNKMIYHSSIVMVNGNYRIYYSAMNKSYNWHIFLTGGKSIDKLDYRTII